MLSSTQSTSSKEKALYERAEFLMGSQNSIEHIKKVLLKENGISEDEIAPIIKHLKKMKHEKDHKTGFMLVLIGAALLLSGFVLTFLNIYNNQSVHFAMFGLTSMGFIVLFIGLYFIFN
ncbi:MAG: hypothetical protein ABI388_02195 [Bacteroidia bacterium]